LKIRRAIIVLLYKNKGDRRECKNHRGISLPSVVKMYGKIVIARVRQITEYMVNDEQDGFWSGRGYVDQYLLSESW